MTETLAPKQDFLG